MSISSVLLMPGLSMPAVDPGDGKKEIERGVLPSIAMNSAPATEQREEADEQPVPLIVESADNVEFYFFWPIPLVFDEFNLD
ncbi:hypothetical protein ACOBQJ_11455 [Pelotomaculum propionicicum]|uniref:hypothetical protein n=1 Tax=Pelotomaculum propionicicum TaxID=258475 RepID=UPI003B7B3A39